MSTSRALFGRFHDGDRDLLSMLAAQAALTLANLRRGRGSGGQGGRTHGRGTRLAAQAEQRAAELAVINSIQQGMSGSLDFQGIVDLVGDALRERFGTGDLSIQWIDHEAMRLAPCTSTSTVGGWATTTSRTTPSARSCA